jgi:bifunctional DNA-binding transcriptional regulator/antitoxin component of YhaV-PrlF toxin-antitoxin module
LVNSTVYQVGGLFVTTAEKFRVSTSGQMSLPAAVRRRWHLEKGGTVEVLDLGFGVLTLPAGYRGHLLDHLLPADAHYAAVAAEDDPDLRNT